MAQSGVSNLIKIFPEVLEEMDKKSPIHVLCLNIVFLTEIESLPFFIQYFQKTNFYYFRALCITALGL